MGIKQSRASCQIQLTKLSVSNEMKSTISTPQVSSDLTLSFFFVGFFSVLLFNGRSIQSMPNHVREVSTYIRTYD